MQLITWWIIMVDNNVADSSLSNVSKHPDRLIDFVLVESEGCYPLLQPQRTFIDIS